MSRYSWYTEWNSPLHKVNPEIKVLWMISLWLLAFIFQDPRWNGLLLASILGLMAVARFPKSVLLLLARIAVPLAVLFIVMWSFLLPSGRVLGGFVLPLAGLTIVVTSDGLLWGIIASLRILILLLSTLSFLVTTSEIDLITGLRGLKVPYLVSFVVSLTFRLMSVINGDLATIQDARKARALPEKMNPLTRIKTALSLVVPLVMVSVRRIQSITNSIEARGFSPGAKRTFYYEPRSSAAEKSVVVGFVGLVIVALVLRVWLGYFEVFPGRL